MQLGRDQHYPNVETLAVVIAHSQIVVEQPRRPAPRLPAGFDDVDLAVLDWIAAEGRRLGRGLLSI
jgi:hypothetical protein